MNIDQIFSDVRELAMDTDGTPELKGKMIRSITAHIARKHFQYTLQEICDFFGWNRRRAGAFIARARKTFMKTPEEQEIWRILEEKYDGLPPRLPTPRQTQNPDTDT